MASKAIKMAVFAVGGIALFGGATFTFLTLKKRQQPPAEESAEKPGAASPSPTDPNAGANANANANSNGNANDPNAAKPAGEETAKGKEPAAKPKAEEGVAEKNTESSKPEDAPAKPAESESAKTPAATEGSPTADGIAPDVTFKLPSPYTESQF